MSICFSFIFIQLNYITNKFNDCISGLPIIFHLINHYYHRLPLFIIDKFFLKLLILLLYIFFLTFVLRKGREIFNLNQRYFLFYTARYLLNFCINIVAQKINYFILIIVFNKILRTKKSNILL